MRRHSAEHLITGSSSPWGTPKIFSDSRSWSTASTLTEEQIRGVERRFNEVVDEDAPVRVYYEIGRG